MAGLVPAQRVFDHHWCGNTSLSSRSARVTAATTFASILCCTIRTPWSGHDCTAHHSCASREADFIRVDRGRYATMASLLAFVTTSDEEHGRSVCSCSSNSPNSNTCGLGCLTRRGALLIGAEDTTIVVSRASIGGSRIISASSRPGGGARATRSCSLSTRGNGYGRIDVAHQSVDRRVRVGVQGRLWRVNGHRKRVDHAAWYVEPRKSGDVSYGFSRVPWNQTVHLNLVGSQAYSISNTLWKELENLGR